MKGIRRHDKGAAKGGIIDGVPLTQHPGTPKLWQRYLRQQRMQTARFRKDSLFRQFAGSWKDFLMTEAINDPAICRQGTQ